MKRKIPIFKTRGESYVADSCQPLVDAVARGSVQLQALVHGHYPGRLLPSGVLPGLKTVGYWSATEHQDWGLPMHLNEGIEITFLESGRLSFSVGATSYTLLPSSLTLTRPWQSHRVGDPSVGPGKLHWLILDVGVRRPNQEWTWPNWIMLTARDRTELANILRQTHQPVWKGTGEIRHCVRAMALAIEADREGSSVSAITIRINELLMLLLDLLKSRNPRLDEGLTSSRASVQMFLDDLVLHPEHLSLEWTVEEMAESCGLGVTQFVHIVNQLTNMAPAHFLSHCRLDHASKLLSKAEIISVTDIAQRCGFSSSQYFANAFRKRFGCTPSEFRMTHGVCPPQ
jgi:AraC family transcriptional regulator, 4-hydroxyphenylacetate 3-monooxygenase operon regulatory protein